MVNSNEGLEALAALASAVPASADNGSGIEKNGSINSNQDQGHHHLQGNANGMHAGQNSGSAPFPQMNNQNQLQSVLQAAATSPQWQQALTAASANATATSSASAQAPNANNNSNNNNNSNHQQLNALANLQRQLQQADPSSLMAIQQQLNYLNLLQLAQPNQQQQQQAPPPQQQQQANMNPQLQALQLALAGRNISGLSHLLGGAPTGTLDLLPRASRRLGKGEARFLLHANTRGGCSISIVA